MKLLLSVSLATVYGAIFVHGTLDTRATGGYVQNSSGSASFTMYSGCGSPACGKTASGFTAAINQLAFGSGPGLGPGDACGRCFSLTGQADPYSPAFTGPFKTVIVKVTDLCPVSGNEEWCGQSTSATTNQHGAPFHFDLCEDTGAAAAFFPSGHANGQELTAQVCGMELASTGSLQVFGPQALAAATKVHLIDFYSFELSDSLRDIDRHRSFVKYPVS
ncbi:glycoside hydrolase family 45 protein [Heterobasidion irregulare TC 32-1]|uniref:Glycoside hydrolase family 45 protein n=1 Tax=Heterobasidion irregulare (strain TC 32-1) TaxID=747525 RepID=W4JZK5_HETIT|nr:glycoside hydrolase family 45 protein [Heterobasidion irregulare TC 32-1]ETW79013.1 glycoside hydrolase family 45 protein [Heterobasidion irregulare TC 32-1]